MKQLLHLGQVWPPRGRTPENLRDRGAREREGLQRCGGGSRLKRTITSPAQTRWFDVETR